MKKVIAFICMFAIVIPLALASGCKRNSMSGVYKTQQLYCMGLTATQQSFDNYSKNRTNREQEYNTLYKPMALLMNTSIEIHNDGTAVLEMLDFDYLLRGDAHYSNALEKAKANGYVQGNDLVIDNLVWIKDNSQSNAYYIYPVNEKGERMSLSDIWSNSIFSAPYIHATIKDDQISCKVVVCVYEKNNEPAGVALTTTVTVNMSK